MRPYVISTFPEKKNFHWPVSDLLISGLSSDRLERRFVGLPLLVYRLRSHGRYDLLALHAWSTFFLHPRSL